MKICVFGASSETIDNIYKETAHQFGETLAKAGHTLIFGAGKYGVMGAVAKGAFKENGRILGIVPHFFDNMDVIFPDCQLIQTETMGERKKLMEDISDAFVVMPGGIGTFEEFYEVLTLKQLGRHNKPIVLYNVNNYYDNILKMHDHTIKENFMSEKCRNLFFVSDNPQEIMDYIQTHQGYQYNKYKF